MPKRKGRKSSKQVSAARVGPAPQLPRYVGMPLSALPEEVLEYIFGHVESKSSKDILSVCLVNKKFNRIARESVLFHHPALCIALAEAKYVGGVKPTWKVKKPSSKDSWLVAPKSVKAFQSFAQCVEGNPRLLTYVRQLELRIDRTSLEHPTHAANVVRLAKILIGLGPHVEHLEFESMSDLLSRTIAQFRISNPSAPLFPKTVDMTLHVSCGNENIGHIIQEAPSLQCLEVADCSRSGRFWYAVHNSAGPSKATCTYPDDIQILHVTSSERNDYWTAAIPHLKLSVRELQINQFSTTLLAICPVETLIVDARDSYHEDFNDVLRSYTGIADTKHVSLRLPGYLSTGLLKTWTGVEHFELNCVYDSPTLDRLVALLMDTFELPALKSLHVRCRGHFYRDGLFMHWKQAFNTACQQRGFVQSNYSLCLA